MAPFDLRAALSDASVLLSPRKARRSDQNLRYVSRFRGERGDERTASLRAWLCGNVLSGLGVGAYNRA